MKAWLRSLLAASLLALALACGGMTDDGLDVPPPGATESDAADSQPSVLNIPMTITWPAMRESVDAGLPTPLYKETGRELAGRMEMNTTVKRDGDSRVFSRGDAMVIEVPTKVKVKVYRRKLNGDKGADLGTGSASLVVRVSSTPVIQDDWSMIGNTEITWRWTDSPSISIAGVDISLSDRLDDKIDAAMLEAAASVDAMMLEEAPLRTELEAIWADLGTARQLKRSPSVWVRFAPEALFSTNPEMAGTGMLVTIGARGILDASLSQRMNDAEATPLADRQPPASDSGARLHVPLKLAWDSLKSTLAQRLEGTVFETSGASATITEMVDLYPSGDSLAIGLKLSIETPAGQTDVTAWATGRLEIDSAGESLSISDFSYDAATGNAIIDSAHEALKGQVVSQLKELLTVPISDEIRTVESTFTEILSGVELSEGVVMSGEISQVRVNNIRLSDSFLILDVAVICDLSLSVTATGG
ncbi:MAG: DUF4403 family protein [Myxococcota bacterium]|nr:DUF4403 family protein [Myxococcota bacterium]